MNKKNISRKIVDEIKEKFFRIRQRLLQKEIIHFLHIGKTGGSSIKYALTPFRNHKKFAIFLHRHTFHLKHIPRGEKAIFFLRDPISRFVSGFYSRKRQGRPRIFVPWSPLEQAAFEAFETPNQLAVALNDNNRQLRKNAEKAMNSILHVKNSYWEWFENYDYFTSRKNDILLFGFQETLSADFERLKKLLDLPQECRLPTDSLHAHINPKDANTSLEPQAIENLKKWYRKEYEFIEFCKELMQED